MVKKLTKKEMKELDKVWARNVFARDENKCQVCQKEVFGRNKHPHHIIPKCFKGLRWDINNGITLCYQHHKVGKFAPHMNALWFTFWLKSRKRSQYDYCIDKLNQIQFEK